LVGWTTGNVAGVTTVTKSYSSGSVNGSTNVGGLVGWSDGTYINSYWDTQTSGRATSAGGTGKTTAQLMTQATYSGWDFTNTWWMSEGNTRPLLRSEYSTNITNAHQLQLMALNLGASYKLTNDISMAELAQASGVWNTSKGFIPVGGYTGNVWTPFTGSFDGLGHTISNLNINRSSEDWVGLFGAAHGIGGASFIRNVGLVGGSVTGKDHVGMLAGYVYDPNGTFSIVNTYATGTVTGITQIGGLIGYNGGTIASSYSTGVVAGSGQVGGLVGYNLYTIDGSYTSGPVSGGTQIGGLAGYNGGWVSNSYSTGVVSGNSNDYGSGVGGLVGWNYGGIVSSSYATGAVTNTGASNGNGPGVGALIGYSNSGSISDSHSSGTVSGTGNSAGGLIGFNANGSSISNSYATGQVSGNYLATGGLVGGNGGTLTSSYATGTVTASGAYLHYIGGLVGANGGAISSSYAEGMVTGSGHSEYAGGLVGVLSGGSITGSYATGVVQGIGNLGGLVGVVNGAYTVSQSYATGNVSGSGGNVGGLIGQNYGSVISSHAAGTVTGTSSVGGLIGENRGALVSDAYATGAVTGLGQGGDGFGGLIGTSNSGEIINSYATGNVIGGVTSMDSGGLVGKLYLGSISSSHATGSVRSMNDAGGLVGIDYGATISNSYATGNVTGLNGVGGLVGQHINANAGDVPTSFATVTNSYATGLIASGGPLWNGISDGNSYNVGGLVGINGGIVTDSYATGAVNGISGVYVGGLVGNNIHYGPYTGAVERSYSSGAVTGATNVGGLIGKSDQGATALSSYWNVTSSTRSSSDGGIGLTPTQMTQKDSFAGFDFSTAVWRIYEGDTSPLLKTFLIPLIITADNVSKSYDGSGWASQLSNVSYSVAGAATSGHLFNYNSNTPYGATGVANAGTYLPKVYSDQLGYDIVYINGTLTINRTALQVTANNASKTYGDTLTIAGTAFSTVGLQNNEAVGTVALASAGTAVSASVAGGPYAITPSSPTGGTFNPANYNISYVNGVLAVTPANLTIAADNKSREYGDANPVLTATATGLKGADTNAILSGLATAALNISNTGSYVIDASNASAGTNYTITVATNGTLTITPAPLTVTADDKTKIQTQPNPTLTASYSGFKLGQNASVLSGSLLLATTAVKDSAAGNYPITASGQTSANYSISYVDGKLKVLASLEPENHGEPEHAYGNAIAIAHSGEHSDTSGGRNAGGTLGGNSINNGGNGPGTPPVTNDNSPAALTFGLPLTIVSVSAALPEAGQPSAADRPPALPSRPDTSPTLETGIAPTPAPPALTSSRSGGFAIAVAPMSSTGGVAGLSVMRGIPDMVITPGVPINISVPSDAFAHSGTNPTVTLSATQANGQPLPSWLRFDSAMGTFSGVPPPGFRSNVAIRVIARDQTGRSAGSSFNVRMGGSGGR
jgi:hypothetical protein